jgi:hypothetical protein
MFSSAQLVREDKVLGAVWSAAFQQTSIRLAQVQRIDLINAIGSS